jgi:hypothetical protein
VASAVSAGRDAADGVDRNCVLRMRIKLIQIDGDLPNLALMKLSHFYKSRGDEVTFVDKKIVRRDMFEPEYDLVLASAIFDTSKKKIALLRDYYPTAVIGGTAISIAPDHTIENVLGIPADYPHLDYSIYPAFEYSIGMTQRGCHMKCGFCCVWQKEGKNRPTAIISEIYRGEPHPRKLILLDNDFQTRTGWQEICEEIIDGDFQVAFIQGINIRALKPEHGTYFSQMKFRGANFNRKRFYCAWDNERDIKSIERGLGILEDAGIARSDVTPYFLCNFYTKGLTDDVWSRFLFMVDRGVRPFAMVYEKWTLPPRDDLKIFQNWVNTHNCYAKPTKEGFEEYKIYYMRTEKSEPDHSLLENL